MQLNAVETVEHWSLQRLIPYAKNARTHDDTQVSQIAGSIAEFGFVNPILVAIINMKRRSVLAQFLLVIDGS